MCVFCEVPYVSILTVELGEYENGDPVELYIDTDGQNLRAFDNDPKNSEVTAMPIKYCPMCGRNLNT
jgi:hypothetical protein